MQETEGLVAHSNAIAQQISGHLHGTCPICQSTRSSLVILSTTYCLLNCRSCATWFDPIPKTNLSAQYSYEYYFAGLDHGRGYANYMADMSSNRNTFIHRFKQAERVLGHKGRVLDLGCALGESLIVAKEQGWSEQVGVEVSDFCVKAGRERGLNILHKEEFLNKTPQGYFDLVLMQDVLEHVKNPAEELSLALSTLRPGGLLFISTPNISSLSRRLLGRHWYHFKPGEHLIYFSPSGLNMALLSAGFTRIVINSGVSVMGIAPILQRLSRYSRMFFWVEKLARKIGIGNVSIPIRVGNLDAWAIKTKEKP